MSHTVNRLPENDHSNGWSALLPARQPQPSLHGSHKVDWVIVGAGYAGVAAARQLARQDPGASIALVEAGEVGENASGRNSGFAIDLPHTSSSVVDERKDGGRAIRVNQFGISELDSLVKTHQLACDWEKRGRYHVAVTEKVSSQALRKYAENLDIWQQPYIWFTRKELEQRLGTDYYAAGIYTPGTYLVNPAALIRGLADSLPAQVKRFENSPVIEANLQGSSPFVRTPRGILHARKLVLTVNAFAQAFGVFRERQIPILLYASLTRILSHAEVSSLGSDVTWGATPAQSTTGSTIRLTRDGRLLIRQGFEYSPNLRSTESRRAKAKAVNLELLRRRFPQLGNLGLEHSWMGWLAVSRNHAPAFGQIAANAYAVSCCNGSGIVRHTAAGMLIADMAADRKNPLIDDFLSQGIASYIPPRPMRDIGVGWKLLWDQWQGRAER